MYAHKHVYIMNRKHLQYIIQHKAGTSPTAEQPFLFKYGF